MKAGRLLSLGFACVLLATVSAAAGATPLAGSCAPGTAYDPACDVNQDNQININDIQLTAGHWNQTGTWLSDNQHNHLGQTWTGTNNPLKLTGSYGGPDYAPLVLSNSAADGIGLRVSSALYDGVYVDSAGINGVRVNSAEYGVVVGSAGNDGVYVHWAAGDGVSVERTGGTLPHPSPLSNGVEVGAAEGHGLYVGWADENGVNVEWASGDGVYVRGAMDDGVYVYGADDDGIQIGGELGGIFTSPDYGLYVPSPGTPNSTLLPNTADAAGEWALFTYDKIRAANVTLDAQTLVAVVGGDQPLSPGDVVSAIGLADPIPGSLNHLAQVRLATADQANIVGVVSSRMALQPAPGKEGEQVMHSTDGPARPGDYVAITVLGAAQVKVQDGEDIQPGQRLTAGADGSVRSLQTRTLDGMVVAEGASVIGVALEASDKNGMVWVLVNPQ